MNPNNDPCSKGLGPQIMQYRSHLSRFVFNKVSGHLKRFKTQNAVVQQKPTYRSWLGAHNRALDWLCDLVAQCLSVNIIINCNWYLHGSSTATTFCEVLSKWKAACPDFLHGGSQWEVIFADSYHVLLQLAVKPSWILMGHQHPVKQQQNITPPTLGFSRHTCLSYKHLQGTNQQLDTCIHLPVVYSTVKQAASSESCTRVQFSLNMPQQAVLNTRFYISPEDLIQEVSALVKRNFSYPYPVYGNHTARI